MLDLYIERDSIVHRLPPGLKVLCLVSAGSALFWLSNVWIVAAAMALILLLYRIAHLSMAHAWSQLRPALWVVGIIVALQLLFGTISLAVLVSMRFAVLLLLAGLLTLTTRSGDLIHGIEHGLAPLGRFGADPRKISLAISLTLRFVPVLARVVEEVREAQRVRGLEMSIIALVVPVLIRTLKMSEDISDAIDARGF